jgi:type VI protein secretion system component Hcp
MLDTTKRARPAPLLLGACAAMVLMTGVRDGSAQSGGLVETITVDPAGEPALAHIPVTHFSWVSSDRPSGAFVTGIRITSVVNKDAPSLLKYAAAGTPIARAELTGARGTAAVLQITLTDALITSAQFAERDPSDEREELIWTLSASKIELCETTVQEDGSAGPISCRVLPAPPASD